MISLINCPPRDMNSYYSGCTLFLEDHTPVQLDSFNNDKVAVVVSSTQTHVVGHADLKVQYLRPFFDENGRVHGVQVARSYKRAPVYDRSVYNELKQFSLGQLPSTFKDGYGRVAYNFFVKPLSRKLPSALWYYDECVGFYANGAFYVKDEYINQRLCKVLGGTHVVYTLQI